ncbi:HAD family hydrolase [Streptomyces sp. NPDC059398]|uniref:HAD family hydrolase n=1 Tax=Streptomyces sp. NPDC059398 TaxID=3346820 RepID=UPI00367459CC
MELTVLWDIDHTLIENAGVSKEIYAAAFTALAGSAPSEPVLDLPVGAYGADAHQRSGLVAVARERAQRLRGVPDDVPVVLVGDTPRDVEAALATRSGIIAVASGVHSVEELSAAGAQVVLPDLTDTERVLGILETFAAH